MNWLRVQPLAQNSPLYLYSVNHNFLSLLLGSHEDLWSSGALNYNSCYKHGRMKDKKYRETINRPRNNDIFRSQLYTISNTLLTSKYDTFCCSYLCIALPRIIHWEHIPWAIGRMDGDQLERWMPILFIACSTRSSCSLYISKYFYKPSYVSILRDIKP